MTRSLFAVLLTLYSTAFAQSPTKPKVAGFNVELTVGLNRHNPGGVAYPFVLTIRNETKSEFKGFLEVQGDEGLSIKRELTIPNTSKKRYHFALDLQRNNSLDFSLRQGRKVYWSQHVPLSVSTGLDHSIRIVYVDRDSQQLPIQQQTTLSNNPVQTIPLLRPLATRSIRAWELPTAEQALHHFHGVFLAKNTQVKQLMPEQVTAMASYLSNGGTLFVHSHHNAFLERLHRKLPLPSKGQWQDRGDHLQYKSVGIGRLYRYDLALNEKSNAVRALLTRLSKELQQLRDPRFPKNVGFDHFIRSGGSERSVITLLAVVAVFILYTLVIGPGTFIFRKKKRAMAIFILASIATFSLISCVTAVFVRQRDGDISWMSATELTPDGGVQSASLILSSVGGHKHELRLTGKHADFWRIRNRPYNPYRRTVSNDTLCLGTRHLEAFGGDKTDSVRLSPWSKGYGIARAYVPEMKPLEIRLIGGKKSLTLHIKNPNSFPIHNARAVTALYTASENYDGIVNRPRYRDAHIGTLLPGVVVRRELHLTFPLNFNEYQNSNLLRQSSGDTALLLDHLTSRRLDCTIVGEIKKSPALSFTGSDFVMQDQKHYVVQRIPAEELPDASGYMRDGSKMKPAQKRTLFSR